MKTMISRRTRTCVAQLMLGVVLFAQAALATAACDWLQAAPARAIAANSSEHPCHEEPASNANLCLAQCLSADQSADTPQLVLPAWIEAAPLVIAVRDRWSGPVLIVQFVLPRPAAPPPRILFQSFQI